MPGRGLYLNENAWAKPISSTSASVARKSLVALARKADDEVGRERDVRTRPPQARDPAAVVVRAVAPVHRAKDAVRAGLHRQMQERHQLRHVAVRRDQLGAEIARMRGRVANPLQAIEVRERADQAGEIPVATIRSGAAVGVDVLPEQRDLARAGRDQPPRLGQDRRCRPRGLGAARVRDHAEGAELVAALLHGQERRDAGRCCQLLGQAVELALDREVGVELRLAAARAPVEQLGQPVIALRPDHDIDVGRALEQRRALGLRDAAGDPDQQIVAGGPPLAAQLLQAAELRIDLLGRFRADVAGIEDDQIGVVRAIGHRVAVRRQRVRHATGVVDIHLAAVGLDEELLRHASAAAKGRVRLIQQVGQLVAAPRSMSLYQQSVTIVWVAATASSSTAPPARYRRAPDGRC